MVAKEIGELPGKRFAVVVDEAHSSQSGESTKPLKAILATKDLDEAEREDADSESGEADVDNLALAEAVKRGHVPNLSLFAFTATPKPKTLELFGAKRADRKFAPFHLYNIRQAIRDSFSTCWRTTRLTSVLAALEEDHGTAETQKSSLGPTATERFTPRQRLR